jgi:DNA-binding Xre family transcriptional regulator
MKELIQGLDGPRTAQQELFYDLEDAAAVIGWSVMELTTLAANGKASSDTMALQKICALLKAQQEKIAAYAGEVKRQRINRSEVIG